MGETEEEKVTKPSEEEEQAEGPSDVGEAVDDFFKEKAKEKPSEEETEEEEKAAEEKPEEKEEKEETEEVEEKEPESPEIPPELLKLDEHLKENPLMLNIDGKDVEVNSAEKLRTYSQFGYKGYDMKGELKKKEEELQKGADQLQNIVDEIATAKKEGRFIIKPKDSSEKPSEEEKAEEEEEEEELDPAMKEMKKRIKKLEKENEDLKFAFLEDKIDTADKSLKKEIEGLKKKYPLAYEKDIYHRLAELDKDNKPKYKTVEEAMKASQEESNERFTKFLENNPDYQKATKEQKEKIVAEYMAKEKELTKAPVSPPSETPAGGAPPQGEEKEEDYKDPQTAFETFQKQQKAKQEAANKS